MKKETLIVLLIIVLFSLSFVNAVEPVNESVNKTNISVEYDPEILEAFNKTDWVRVIINLKNMSEADNLLSDFSENEFKLERKSSRRISAEISEEGFNKLFNDERVEAVYLDVIVYGIDSDNKSNYTAYYDSEIWEAFNKTDWVRVIVYYESDVENKNFNSIEERIEYIKNVTNSLFGYIPETKMRKIKTGLSNSFTAEITEKGFDKLINNTKVNEIYLDIIGSVALDDSVPLINTDNIKTNKVVNITKNESIVEDSIEKVEIIKEPKSWFSRFIQFIKSLFKLK